MLEHPVESMLPLRTKHLMRELNLLRVTKTRTHQCIEAQRDPPLPGMKQKG